MARVNIGINPIYLADQHLIAESVEITMITGGLKKQKCIIKSPIPTTFKLGTGHINFFKNKILYLDRRLKAVNQEMINRGFNPSTKLDLSEYPKELVNDWNPNIKDSNILRQRVYERLLTRSNGKPGSGFYRYKSEYLVGNDLFKLANQVKNSELFYV